MDQGAFQGTLTDTNIHRRARSQQANLTLVSASKSISETWPGFQEITLHQPRHHKRTILVLETNVSSEVGEIMLAFHDSSEMAQYAKSTGVKRKGCQARLSRGSNAHSSPAFCEMLLVKARLDSHHRNIRTSSRGASSPVRLASCSSTICGT
jgi:hypothetical protein